MQKKVATIKHSAEDKANSADHNAEITKKSDKDQKDTVSITMKPAKNLRECKRNPKRPGSESNGSTIGTN